MSWRMVQSANLFPIEGGIQGPFFHHDKLPNNITIMTWRVCPAQRPHWNVSRILHFAAEWHTLFNELMTGLSANVKQKKLITGKTFDFP